MAESVFRYRAPDEEDKVHLQAVQAAIIEVERAVNAVISGGKRQLPTLEAQVDVLACVIAGHVPQGHERDVAEERLISCWSRAQGTAGWDSQHWTKVWDALREVRMWANAGIVLA